MSLNPHEEHIAANVHDRVVNQIFGSGLTLARILSAQRFDDEVAGQLHDVIEALDAAVRELRTSALAGIIASHEARPRTPHPLPEVWRRRLSRITIDEVFAYAIGGHDFYRAGDHMLWAHETDGLLLSARSGRPLARRDGNLFCDIESNVPLYYEDRPIEPPAVESPEGSP